MYNSQVCLYVCLSIIYLNPPCNYLFFSSEFFIPPLFPSLAHRHISHNLSHPHLSPLLSISLSSLSPSLSPSLALSLYILPYISPSASYHIMIYLILLSLLSHSYLFFLCLYHLFLSLSLSLSLSLPEAIDANCCAFMTYARLSATQESLCDEDCMKQDGRME